MTSEIDTSSDTMINTPHHASGSQLGSVADRTSSRAASSDADPVSYGYGGFVPDDSSEGIAEIHNVKLEREQQSASRYKVCHIRYSFNSTLHLTFCSDSLSPRLRRFTQRRRRGPISLPINRTRRKRYHSKTSPRAPRIVSR